MTNHPLPNDARQAIHEALFTGQKILAVKLHREATGSGLRDAKTAIDALENELRAKSPERFLAHPASGGCLGAIAAAAGMTVLVLWHATV